jgi:hypothetical protein
MQRLPFLVAFSLCIAGFAAPAAAEVRRIEIDVAGYLCGL